MSGAAVDGGPAAALRPIEELIASLGTGAGEIPVVASKRCLDIDVLSELQLDLLAPAGTPDRLCEELARVLSRRYRKLREPFSEDNPKVVITRGRRSVPGSDDLDSHAWRSLLAAVAPNTGALLSVHPDEATVETEERAAVFAVDLGDEDASDEPFAYVAVLAWFGALAREGGRATGSEELLRVLSGTAARNTPLHVLCVTDSEVHGEGLFRECERLRVSLVLSGALSQPDLVTVSRADLRSHRDPRSVAVVRCPSFKAGVPTSGMTRVRLDLWKGEAEVAFRPDLGSDWPVEAVQVTSQLISASRITSAERRLYSHVDDLLEEEEAGGARSGEVRDFRARVRREWAETGYVTLSDSGGRLPVETDRTTKYKLLLLARERPGGYDMLLSNHSPLRPSLLSEWNTLLLPAFKEARALLEYLRDDVIRQVRQRAESFERVAHARAFEAAVDGVLAKKDGWQGFWKDEIETLDEREMTAISPTTGVGTNYVYELVTVRPLAEAAKPLDDGLDEVAAKVQRDRRQIIEWLRDLDAVEIPREGVAPGPGLSLEALTEGGCGVRWDPAAGLAAAATPAQRRRAATASPGTIWFPLADPGEEPHWRACPSIVSRNADVMAWVEEVLERERDDNGRLSEKLLLGGA